MVEAINARTEVSHNPNRLPDIDSENTRENRARTTKMNVSAEVEGHQATGRYSVESESGSTYLVDLRDEENVDGDVELCDCMDYHVNLGKDGKCKHARRVALEIQFGGLVSPGEWVLPMNEVVTVDWSKGEGPRDVIIGVLTGMDESDGQTVLEVTDYHADDCELGKVYYCTPEWIFDDGDSNERDTTASPESDESDMSVPEGQKCSMCDESAVNPEHSAPLCEEHHPEM
jgi:hypothetical protein